MAFLLSVAIIDAGDRTIKVVHQFFGLSEREVDTYRQEHLGNCGYFRSAETEGRTVEMLEEISANELPTAKDFEDEEEEEYEEG